jgi:hypothetical protein
MLRMVGDVKGLSEKVAGTCILTPDGEETR